jgi:dimethylamine monooxygenase subunit B
MINEKIITVSIKSITVETSEVKCFTLVPLESFHLPKFSSGSHITTYLEGEKDLIVRHYSLTNHPDENDSYQIAIRLSETSRGGSRYWHSQLNVGDKLNISYPKNHFPLSFKAKHHVFYAAGIGITPFLSMMAELKDREATFELHYAAKSIDQCAFYPIIKERYPTQSHFYFSNERNRMSNTSLQDHPIGTHVYFCGPESFISTLAEYALTLGYPKSSIHYEHFTVVLPKKVTEFQVKLTSGEIIHVTKEQTLLEALLEKGMKPPYSCRVGHCGTCELRVVQGEVEHYDTFSAGELEHSQNSILTCVSRAKSNQIVIDF